LSGQQETLNPSYGVAYRRATVDFADDGEGADEWADLKPGHKRFIPFAGDEDFLENPKHPLNAYVDDGYLYGQLIERCPFLVENQKNVLREHWCRGLNFSQIGREAGKTAEAVRTTFYRAIGAIQRNAEHVRRVIREICNPN
jgi:hypothetical protein